MLPHSLVSGKPRADFAPSAGLPHGHSGYCVAVSFSRRADIVQRKPLLARAFRGKRMIAVRKSQKKSPAGAGAEGEVLGDSRDGDCYAFLTAVVGMCTAVESSAISAPTTPIADPKR